MKVVPVDLEFDFLGASVVDSIPAVTSTGQDFTEYSFDEQSSNMFNFSWGEE